eukprot:TRINITY_DN15365_c0_g1_i3.p1 TRINITY_DN15365_c0_g1~~TRINITY_DN15365_c0_g1_i3.p1  ORF type:complete len:415 (+),score=105.82 TRINITY_DN15365_c0_g1_i3:330-1574(+)
MRKAIFPRSCTMRLSRSLKKTMHGPVRALPLQAFVLFAFVAFCFFFNLHIDLSSAMDFDAELAALDAQILATEQRVQPAAPPAAAAAKAPAKAPAKAAGVQLKREPAGVPEKKPKREAADEAGQAGQEGQAAEQAKQAKKVKLRQGDPRGASRRSAGVPLPAAQPPKPPALAAAGKAIAKTKPTVKPSKSVPAHIRDIRLADLPTPKRRKEEPHDSGDHGGKHEDVKDVKAAKADAEADTDEEYNPWSRERSPTPVHPPQPCELVSPDAAAAAGGQSVADAVVKPTTSPRVVVPKGRPSKVTALAPKPSTSAAYDMNAEVERPAGGWMRANERYFAGSGRFGNRGWGPKNWWFQMREHARHAGTLPQFFSAYPAPFPKPRGEGGSYEEVQEALRAADHSRNSGSSSASGAAGKK